MPRFEIAIFEGQEVEAIYGDEMTVYDNGVKTERFAAFPDSQNPGFYILYNRTLEFGSMRMSNPYVEGYTARKWLFTREEAIELIENEEDA